MAGFGKVGAPVTSSKTRPKMPAKVWLFDPQAMVLGDILFERGSGASSALIAGVTGGRFSHVMIWVGGDFIEAMPDGVRSLSFARVPVLQPANWLLLRAKPEHAAAARRAADEARQMVFKTYDRDGALRTVLGPRRRAIPKSRFCSQLVAEAYQRAGLILLPGRRPETIHPNMLASIATHARCELPLIDSERVQSGPYPPEFLDRSTAFRSSGMRRESDISRVVFAAVEDSLARVELPPTYSGPPPGNLSEALDILPHLPPPVATPIADTLLSTMDANGYFDLLVPAMADLLPRVSTAPKWRDQVRGWHETGQRHRRNAAASGDRLTVMPHPIWRRLQTMYVLNAGAFDALIAKALGEAAD